MKKTYDFSEEYLVDIATQSLARPDDFGYYGDTDMFNTWGWAGIDYSRDSGVMDLSNYRAFHRDVVSSYEDDFSSERFNHWAVGWIERTVVRVLHNDVDGIVYDNITEAFCETIVVLDSLKEYPVLDDELYSEIECEENITFVDNFAPEMVDHTIEGWSEKLLYALLDSGVEMCPDEGIYASEDEMIMAAYDAGLCSKQYEDDWMEFAFNNNLTKPAIFLPKQTVGQLGMRI